MGQIFAELKRRNVFRVGAAYLVAGWIVIQVVGSVAGPLGLPEWTGALVIVLLAACLPLALILAWAFELTPDGVKKTDTVDPAASATSRTGRSIDRMIVVALAVVVGFLLFDRFAGAPDSPAPGGEVAQINGTSIAVLPFVNMSDDAGNEYFSDGMSEEILNVLARIPDLQVTSRSSAFQFKGHDIDIPTVARQLGVANVLEGSVRKAGTRVRITAQLIDATTDHHLWSATYDRELTDVFAVQDEIAAAIVAALKEALGIDLARPYARPATVSAGAHEAFLRGRHLVVQRTRATIEGAVAEFGKAIARDPDYALAHAELAQAVALLVRGQYGDLTTSEASAKAQPHAERALALDPGLAEAHAAMGVVVWEQGKLEEALTHFRRAVAINPNYSIVHSWMGIVFDEDLGRYSEAFAVTETALRLDPLSLPAIANYVNALIARNRLDEAATELEKLAAIAPALHANIRGLLTSIDGQWANAVLADLDAVRINPASVWSRNFLPWEFAIVGLGEEVLAISPAPRSLVLSMLGRSEDAVTIAKAHLAEDPNALFARRDLGLALAGAGDYAAARPLLEAAWQRAGRVTGNGLFGDNSAAALIAIRRAANAGANVAPLLAAMREHTRQARKAGMTVPVLFSYSADFEDGLASYLAGERRKGLALLAKASAAGYFILPNEAYLQTLYQDPGFAPIRAAQQARQAEQRARVLAVVCTDNPYAAVWQPAPGTCAGFRAGGGD